MLEEDTCDRKSAFTPITLCDDELIYPNDPRRPGNIDNPNFPPQEILYVRYASVQVLMQKFYQLPPVYEDLGNLFTGYYVPQHIIDLYNVPINVSLKKNKKELSREGIEKYQIIEKTKVRCEKCANNVSITFCFSSGFNSFLCVECAVDVFKNVSDLKDWEPNDKVVNNNNIRPTYMRCERIKHAKPFSSFVRYSNKKNDYEVGHLCIFCRNVKRYEYLMKQKSRRFKNQKRLLI